MDFAPIVLFVYNRPWHTEQTLKALMSNELADKSDLYIYCDGPKFEATKKELENIEKVRSVVRKNKWCKNVFIIEQKDNVGLANSIINGVTDVINKYEKIIVLEDDIVTSSGFLKYMNDALSFYEDSEKVMHVSAYMFPHKEKLPETFFFNVPLCWGWATWSRSWKNFNNNSLDLWNEVKQKKLLYSLDKFGGDYLSSQLAHNISGRLNTWFIKWHTSVLLLNGYTLYPKRSLVNNIGFDNSGIHNGNMPEFEHSILINKIEVSRIDVEQNKKAEEIIKNFYNLLKNKTKKNNLKTVIKSKIKNLIFRFFPDFKKIISSNRNIITNTYLGINCKIYPKARISNSIVGNYTYIAENSVVNNSIIGKFCSIGANLMSGKGFHPINGISTHPMFYSVYSQNGMTLSSENKIEEFLPVTIGNDVYIGMNVTILDGVSIGDGAVIGAGAVVSKDIPSYAVAVGNPIRVIKYRFEDDVIDKLLRIKWWDFDVKNLALIEKKIFKVEEFIKDLENSEFKKL